MSVARTENTSYRNTDHNERAPLNVHIFELPELSHFSKELTSESVYMENPYKQTNLLSVYLKT